MVFMAFLHNRYVEFGSFRKFTGFSASHVYIFDNKGSEIFTCSVTSFPADVCNAGLGLLFSNSVAGFCVSHHARLNLCVQSGAPNEEILAKYLKYHFLLYKIASEVYKGIFVKANTD